MQLASQPAVPAAEPALAQLMKDLTWTGLDSELCLWGGRRRDYRKAGKGSSWRWTLRKTHSTSDGGTRDGGEHNPEREARQREGRFTPLGHLNQLGVPRT